MKVLISNDDGIHAEGLDLLWKCAKNIFSEVTVVAPLYEQSAVSHRISLHDPLRIKQHGEGRFSVTGTPADAVISGLTHICKDQKPDLVLSGINHGPNVGYDVYYSGTVAAAREGLIRGIPSVALSLASTSIASLPLLEPAILDILKRIRNGGLPSDNVLNINFPPVDPQQAAGWLGLHGIRGTKVTRIGRRFYQSDLVERLDPRNKPYFWIGGGWPTIEKTEGTDVEMLRQGWISITPIKLDVTDNNQLDQLGHLETEIP